ncbi:MAG: type I DNA topoisomerase [Paludibacteraceae bacterium]|nr:type I DNA topoisomerase [Paludibacteraceae bacterium]
MQKNLVIVESPAKAKTIEKYLGEGYTVKSSMGHIRDLNEKNLSIDLENNFQPIYSIDPEKKKLVAELKKLVKESDLVWLASDEDREGEAIAWHLFEVLGLQKENTRRIVFHEITKDAILNAIKNPRDIKTDLVDAQQARRVLDRIVGYELSPVLWRKIRRGLSAGRVQSVTVRLIVDREEEIKNFKSESSYKVQAIFNVVSNGKKTQIKADLNVKLKTKEEAMAFLEACKGKNFKIEDVSVKPAKRSPAAPFTTSTLQQEASRKLGFSVSQTMSVAQKLYEAGKITYMRTDSVNLSDLAINTARQAIDANYGSQYAQTRRYHTNSKGAQEAHEAIRPTYLANATVDGTAQEKKLYSLIWKRTIASQMADAQLEKTTVTIGFDGESRKFVAEGEVIKFDGFLKVYMESTDDEEKEDSAMLPPLNKGDMIGMAELITATQKFTQRPARYTEASLVHKMEEIGIGRPSTYASTISSVLKRGYVEKGNVEGVKREFNQLSLKANLITDEVKVETVGADKDKLLPTDIGLVTNKFLMNNVPDVMDYNFTAQVEKGFDEVAEGKIEWQKDIASFYAGFHPQVENAGNVAPENSEKVLGVDPKTGLQVSVRLGKYGPMVQIGTAEGDSTPKYASLSKGQRIDTITLDDALKLFELPRTLGEFEGMEVIVNKGFYGPYVLHNKVFTTIPKAYDPMSIDLDTAITLIQDKREKEANKNIASFDLNGSVVEILNGRYGPYFTYNGFNYRIPKDTDPKSLTPEICAKLVAEQPDAKPVRKSAKVKTEDSAEDKSKAKKKTTAKKTTKSSAVKAKK